MSPWSLCLLGVFISLESLSPWSLCLLGVFVSLESLSPWSLCLLGVFVPLESLSPCLNVVKASLESRLGCSLVDPWFKSWQGQSTLVLLSIPLLDIQNHGPQKFREVTERGLTTFSAVFLVSPNVLRLIPKHDIRHKETQALNLVSPLSVTYRNFRGPGFWISTKGI